MKTLMLPATLISLWMLCLSCGHSAKSAQPDADSEKMEVLEDRLPLADPYILSYEGRYWAYGTNACGFYAYASTDLKHWRRSDRLALSPEDSWGDKGYWAPEVYYVERLKKFYMFYTVNEQVCVATADRPEGPFVQDPRQPLMADEKNIDPSLFIDTDGRAYLYFVRFTDGNVIWCAELNPDLKSLKRETLTRCIAAEEEWERRRGIVAEGPSVLKQGDIYYLLYSANHFESPDYAVGYAIADSPFGPWHKYAGNPVLRRDREPAAGLVGTGHGAPFRRADGTWRYIYHAHASRQSVQPRSAYIKELTFSANGDLSIGGEVLVPIVVK